MTSYVSLFSGAGGLDLGLEQAGWDCLYASDLDARAVETLTANRGLKVGRGRKAFSNTVIAQADIQKVSGSAILSDIGRARGDVPLLAGGPPCQSWSSAGHQLGFNDPRGRLFEDYLRLAAELDTRWLVFENVRGLLTARGSDGQPGSALAHIRRRLFERGWQTRVELLNAANYGVPQRRVRLILIGYHAGDAPPLPEQTHTQNDDLSGRTPWVTLGDCLSNLPGLSDEEIIRPAGKMALDLAGLPAGTGAKSPGKAETTRPGGHWGYKQGAFIADLALPARTVTASSQQDWIYDPAHGLRRLTPRDCAAVQTFPADWQFAGKQSDQYRLIGNAVPPLLGRQIGTMLLKHAKASSENPKMNWRELAPLPIHLQTAVKYTQREEARNGASRRAVNSRQPLKLKVG